MTKNLLIKNFKSIKEMNLECKRVNIFVGKPNVGKSNILEALSIFNLPDAIQQNLKLNDLVRHNNFKNLFYDNIPKENLTIFINDAYCTLKYNLEYENLLIVTFTSEEIIQDFQPNLSSFETLKNKFHISNGSNYFYFNLKKDDQSSYETGLGYKSKVKSYSFNKKIQFNHLAGNYLLPPFGQNLFSIIRNDLKLSDELAEYFQDYGLQWVYDEEANVYLTQKQIKNTIYKYPFNSIADTLQRMIFYTTAIETNKDCILVFEEPETNSFPPYTRDLAYKIAANEENQYFISTHSPYLLLNLIENTPKDELNIFVTYYENYETKVKALSSDEIKSLLNDSVDIFFNLDKFVTGA